MIKGILKTPEELNVHKKFLFIKKNTIQSSDVFCAKFKRKNDICMINHIAINILLIG